MLYDLKLTHYYIKASNSNKTYYLNKIINKCVNKVGGVE